MNTNQQLPPEFFQFLKEMPAVMDAVKQVPYLVEQVKQVPYLVEQVKQIPYLVEQVKQIPYLVEQVKQIPYLVGQVKQIPYLVEQVKQIPALAEDVKEMKDTLKRQETTILEIRVEMHEIKRKHDTVFDQAALNVELKPQIASLQKQVTQTFNGIHQAISANKPQLI